MSNKKKSPVFTHKGRIFRPNFGWEWSEELRETPMYWISRVPGTKYRKKDGKRYGVGAADILMLDSITKIT